MSSRMTVIFPLRRAARSRGCHGGCGPGTGCVSRRRRWTGRAHLHVARRDNPNGAWAKSRRQRTVPLDFLVVQAFDAYEFERFGVPEAHASDFLLVNLFRGAVGA